MSAAQVERAGRERRIAGEGVGPAQRPHAGPRDDGEALHPRAIGDDPADQVPCAPVRARASEGQCRRGRIGDVTTENQLRPQIRAGVAEGVVAIQLDWRVDGFRQVGAGGRCEQPNRTRGGEEQRVAIGGADEEAADRRIEGNVLEVPIQIDDDGTARGAIAANSNIEGGSAGVRGAAGCAWRSCS